MYGRCVLGFCAHLRLSAARELPLLAARRAVCVLGTGSHRHFASSDTVDRFEHVRSALKHDENSNEEPHLFASASDPSVPPEPEPARVPPKVDRALLKSVPLRSIEEALLRFVPENIRSSSPASSDDECLTPGQAFYLENRDKLFDNLRRRYYEETQDKDYATLSDSDIESLLPLLMADEEFGSYDSTSVVSPGKHHLWDYNTGDLAAPGKTIHLHKGQMPTLQDVVEILEQERMTNISVVDMEQCNRRDQSMYCIVATGTTRSHCRRVGRLLYRVIVDLDVPFVSSTSYCCNSRSDEWIVARLGPLCVHLMVKELREKHSIEELWEESRAVESVRGASSLDAPGAVPAATTTH